MTGTASSVFFIIYAIGQLINGLVGNKIKARYMMGFGLLLARICNIVYPFVSSSRLGSIAVYGITGFFLAMIYAPMTKVIAENVVPEYAARSALGYEFGALLGTPTVGLMASALPVTLAFGIGGGDARNIFDCVYWGFCIRTYEEYGQINTALIQCCGGDRGIATLWCGI